MLHSISASANSQANEQEKFCSALINLASAWNAKLHLHSHYASPLVSQYRDFDALKSIPITQVAKQLGMALTKTGTGTYAMREGHHTTSLIIFERSNRWKRFSDKESGGVSQGSTIDLVMHIKDCTMREAVNYLVSAFPHHL